jgi:rare lipoprotein A
MRRAECLAGLALARRCRHRWLCLLPLLAALWRSAIASARAGPRTVEPAKAPAKMVRKSNVVQKRGGAYYKDDGPGDEFPDNLDDIPDAQPRLEPLHRFANRPYVVLGKAYEPHASLDRIRSAVSRAGTARSFMARRRRSANPTTCSR